MLKKLNFVAVLICCFAINSFAQSSTVYFYRLKNLVMANTPCEVTVNDTLKFILINGSYHIVNINADSIRLAASPNNIGSKSLRLEKGKTYYIAAEMQNMNAVNLMEKNEFAGKPAIERLEADAKAKEINTENLKLIKITSVSPLPEAKENAAVIYLFRPFNVTGLNLLIKVSDGEFLYEMKNNSSYVIASDKKEVTLISVNEGSNTTNTSLNLKPEKGKVYYVAVLRTGGAIVLSESKMEYAKKEMKLK
ncbi:MAG: DUF2846 domain-containing protein [Cytophagaceae bacterium]|nr:DUF2846 domain-containing protein [Cytophagaceae bacterium]